MPPQPFNKKNEMEKILDFIEDCHISAAEAVVYVAIIAAVVIVVLTN